MKKDLILFDFDGTVINNSEGIFNSIKYALSKMKMPVLPDEALKKFIGPSLFESYYRYCEKDRKRAELFVELYRERFAPIGCLECVLYDGITDVVTLLRSRGAICAVCSSKPKPFVQKISINLGINKLFNEYFCPDFASHTSDKSYLIFEAMEKFKTPKARTVLIGDTHFDVEAAKVAKIESIGVLYGFSEPGELEKAGADYIADTPQKIITILEN